MREAWIIVSVDPENPLSAKLDFNGCDLPHFVNAAFELERYADNPSLHAAHPGASAIAGKHFGENVQVGFFDFRDDAYTFELRGKRLKPFHARGAAFVLRGFAAQPGLQQAVVTALQALAQAQQMAPIVKRVIVPSGK